MIDFTSLSLKNINNLVEVSLSNSPHGGKSAFLPIIYPLTTKAGNDPIGLKIDPEVSLIILRTFLVMFMCPIVKELSRKF
jgi:hypothetical protein